MQVEYPTVLVFRSATTLGPLYEQLTRESVLSVKAEQIATFLGRQITPQLAQEIGSQFSTRIEGACIKHRFGNSSIKMYDKFGTVLRIETTTNDVSSFKHYRKVEHRQGPATRGLAPVKKTIYSLIDLREILFGCNRRYLEHLSALDDFSAGARALDRLTKPRSVEGKTVKGINFFDPIDNALLNTFRRTPGSTSPASAEQTSARSSANSPPHASPGNCAGCATLAQSSAPPEPIDTTSPESAEPQQQHSAASPRASSSRPSHEP